MVKNLEKSIDFYENITGLTITRCFKDGKAEIAFLANKEGETSIELVCVPGAQKFEGKGLFICFLTDKLEESYKKAKLNGLDPSDMHAPDAESRYFYVYDPDGVSVQLKQIF
jgi:lactoylglutathione lyase